MNYRSRIFLDKLKSIGKWIGIIIGVIIVLVAGEQLFDYIDYRTKKVYVCDNSSQRLYHIFPYCSRMHGHKVFTVKLHEACDNGYKLCPECEELYDIKQQASEPASSSHSYIK